MVQSLPITLQLRNNAVIQYADTSYLNFNRNGNVNALKQNLVTRFKDKLHQLNKIEVVENINNFVSKYDKIYAKHKQSLHTKGIDLKDFGVLSNHQAKTLKKNVENLINSVQINYNPRLKKENQKFVSFITLTIPSTQKHTDKVLRKMQTRFLENLKKTYKVEYYVWKAETQKNGNLHFHILIDQFVDWRNIRKLWNSQLFKLGYIEAYQKKMQSYFENGFKMLPNDKRDYQTQYKAYLKNKAVSYTNPNSTDIHSLKNVNNLTNYIVKYMTKKEVGKRSILGAVWGASNELKKIKYPTVNDVDTPLFNEVVTLLNTSKYIKEFPTITDYVRLFVGSVYKGIKLNFKALWLYIQNHYKNKKEIVKISLLSATENIKSIVKIMRFKTVEPVQYSLFNFSI